MSRAERRQYRRMMRGAEQDPLAPRRPARPGRGTPRRTADDRRAAEGRQQPARAAAGPAAPADKGSQDDASPLTARVVVRSILIAALVGYLAFSLQWPNMPFALYFGIGVGVVALGLLIAFRRVQLRMPQPPPG